MTRRGNILFSTPSDERARHQLAECDWPQILERLTIACKIGDTESKLAVEVQALRPANPIAPSIALLPPANGSVEVKELFLAARRRGAVSMRLLDNIPVGTISPRGGKTDDKET